MNDEVVSDSDENHTMSTPDAIELNISQDHDKRPIDPTEDGGHERVSEHEPSYKRQRFEPLPDEAVNLWALSTEMERYANKHMEKFIPEKTVIDTLLYHSPVPTNVVKPGKLDDTIQLSQLNHVIQ